MQVSSFLGVLSGTFDPSLAFVMVGVRLVCSALMSWLGTSHAIVMAGMPFAAHAHSRVCVCVCACVHVHVCSCDGVPPSLQPPVPHPSPLMSARITKHASPFKLRRHTHTRAHTHTQTHNVFLCTAQGGALLVAMPGYQLIMRTKVLPHPLLSSATTFNLPTSKSIDWKLLGGAALFGTGWGAAGAWAHAGAPVHAYMRVVVLLCHPCWAG